jgi:uncharacterized protein (TIGR03067 family)
MARTIALFVATLSLGFAPAPFLKSQRPTTAEAEWKALKGEWLLVSVNSNGVEEKRGREAHTRVYTPGQLKIFSDGRLNITWKVMLDLTKKPTQFVYRSVGGGYEIKALYKVEGNTLTQCHASNGLAPASFRPGKGVHVLVFRRTKW